MASAGYDISASVSTSSNAASRAGEGDVTVVSFGGLKSALWGVVGLLALFVGLKFFKK